MALLVRLFKLAFVLLLLSTQAYAQSVPIPTTKPKPKLPNIGKFGGIVGQVIGSWVGDKVNDGLDWILDPANNSVKPNQKYKYRVNSWDYTDSFSANQSCKKASATYNQVASISVSNDTCTIHFEYGGKIDLPLFKIASFAPAKKPVPDIEPQPIKDPVRPAPQTQPTTKPARPNLPTKPANDPDYNPPSPQKEPEPQPQKEPKPRPSPRPGVEPAPRPGIEPNPRPGTEPSPRPGVNGKDGKDGKDGKSAGQGKPFELPKFCDWAKWFCEGEIESSKDNELDIDPPPTPKEVKLNFARSCPADRSIPITIGTYQYQFVMTYAYICKFMASVGTLMTIISTLYALYILAGIRQ